MNLKWVVNKIVADGMFVDIHCQMRDCKVFHNSFILTLTKEEYSIIGRPIVGETLAITMEVLD